MTKEFDCSPHERLLLKLKSYRFVDPLYSWLAFCQSDRSHSVSIKGTLPQSWPVTSAALQRGFLGPLYTCST